MSEQRPAWAFWPVRRWAITRVALGHPQAIADVRVFRSEGERDAWVAANPGMRQAIGVRHLAVKLYRRRVTGRTNV